MTFEELSLPGLKLITTTIHQDSRGYFLETWSDVAYRKLGIPQGQEDFVQDNESLSHIGVARGLHYQTPPFAQAKLVRVQNGKVIDIVLDLRVGSPGFGKYLMIELSSENKKQLFIPSGFAHGFIALEENTVFSYKTTAPYNKESEQGILLTDVQLNIPTDKIQIVSEKDLQLQTFGEYLADPCFFYTQDN